MIGGEHKFNLKSFMTVKNISIILAVIGFIVFCNSLFNDFILDDKLFIIDPPDVHSINILYLFGRNIFNAAYYRPLTALYFAILYSISGAHSFLYHFFQITFHIYNSIILYILLQTLFDRHNQRSITESEEREWNRLTGSEKVKYLRKYGSRIKQSDLSNLNINLLSFFLSLIFLIHPIIVEFVTYISAIGDPLIFQLGSS